MSTTSRHLASDGVELPVFVTPTELVFALDKRKSLLTVFNPYDNEAQFRIMTTSPSRYDVSITKGAIKPNRRIDVAIRLLDVNIKGNDMPEPTDDTEVIDYFRINLQIGQIKGNKPIKVLWCQNAESACSDLEAHHGQLHQMLNSNSDERTASSSTKLRIRSTKSGLSMQQAGAPTNPHNPARGSRSSLRTPRLNWQTNLHNQAPYGSNVNLVCTLCAIACVIALFLPLSIDTDLCKKAKTFQDISTAQTVTPVESSKAGWMSQLYALLSVSYELKLGCSFALGLFTYRLISTLPD